MSGKEKIIATILSDAEAEAEEIKNAAEKKIADIRAEDERFAEQKEAEKHEEIAANDLSILSRSRLTAELDVRKAVLAKKQEKLSEAFNAAIENILSDGEAYLSFIGGVLKQYAEEGDEVVVSVKDKDRITPSFVEKCAKDSGLNLTYRADGKFSGGVMLEGKTCDKNLTIETIIGEYRKNNESRIAAILFGE